MQKPPPLAVSAKGRGVFGCLPDRIGPVSHGCSVVTECFYDDDGVCAREEARYLSRDTSDLPESEGWAQKRPDDAYGSHLFDFGAHGYLAEYNAHYMGKQTFAWEP